MMEAVRSPRRPLVLGSVLTVALVGQSVLLIAQQMQIDDLRMQPVNVQASIESGPAGPSGPPGPTGPVGPIGPPGKDGADGTDGTNGKDGTNGVNGKDGKDAVAPPPEPAPESSSS
ncbi:hypothetical protein ACFU6R_18390 [Streptomyces sp. NPDC057499]|uniref:hypothetical protein n=1 Tax=Streptomyces sp. NPDC057499 TaxID=3346150 RepID=UPI0036C7F480